MNEFAIEEPKERPTSLTVTSILSFIAEGFIFLALGSMILMKDFISNNKEELLNQNPSEEMELALNALLDNFSMVIVYPFLLNIASCVGVIMMFKLKKTGFHVYTITHLLLIVLSYMAHGEIGWTGLLFSLSFIGLYASNLKHMN